MPGNKVVESSSGTEVTSQASIFNDPHSTGSPNPLDSIHEGISQGDIGTPAAERMDVDPEGLERSKHAAKDSLPSFGSFGYDTDSLQATQISGPGPSSLEAPVPIRDSA